MRKMICTCDACGKEIDAKKGIWKIAVGLSEDSAASEDLPKTGLSDKEFCVSCTEKVTRFLLGKNVTIKKTGIKKASAVDPKKEKPAETRKREAEGTSKAAERTATPPKQAGAGIWVTEKLDQENVILLEQEIRFFLENGQKKEDIIPELSRSYRVPELTVKQMIAQYEEENRRGKANLRIKSESNPLSSI